MAGGRYPLRASTGARPDGGYTVVGVVAIVAVVLLILAGAGLLISMIFSSVTSSTPDAGANANASAQGCSDTTWLDPVTATCVPRTVCAEGQDYVAMTNTCIVAPAVVTAISPPSGLDAGGTAVRITGSGFKPNATVTIDGFEATNVMVIDDTTITATTPGSPNLYPVDVKVINPGGEPGILENAFTYVVVPVEDISAVVPDRGSSDGGEAVIVQGRGFEDGVKVAFGGREALDVVRLDSSTLRVITPSGDLGPTTVNVRNPGEVASRVENAFTYVDQAPRVVAQVRPVRGPRSGGTEITIVGTGFAQGAAVDIGGRPAEQVRVFGSTRITALTPRGAPGPANVAVRNPGLPAAILVDGFTYTLAPTVTEVSPATGPTDGGTEVTISGADFEPGATVSFGSAPATKVTVVGPKKITAVTPKGKAGTVAVTVTNDGQPPAKLPKAFTYDPDATGQGPSAPPSEAKPRCAPISIDPITGPPGAEVTVPGSEIFGSALSGATFTDASVAGSGSVVFQKSPPRLFVTIPADRTAEGVLTIRYVAPTCTGTGTGTGAVRPK